MASLVNSQLSGVTIEGIVRAIAPLAYPNKRAGHALRLTRDAVRYAKKIGALPTAATVSSASLHEWLLGKKCPKKWAGQKIVLALKLPGSVVSETILDGATLSSPEPIVTVTPSDSKRLAGDHRRLLKDNEALNRRLFERDKEIAELRKQVSQLARELEKHRAEKERISRARSVAGRLGRKA